MTIKSIKEQYQNYGNKTEKKSFAVYDYRDGNGKCVIVVSHLGVYRYKDVVQVVRVSDGKELLPAGACRPCDNMEDAIDVAGEMMAEKY